MNLDKNIEEIRAEFPHLKYMIYLGTAGSAPLCLKWYNAIQALYSHRLTGSELGGTGHVFFKGQSMQVRAKMEAAKLINAKKEEITWIERVSRGLQIFLDIIDTNDPWKKGDNVVFTDQGFPSTGHTWLSLRRKGVDLKQIKNVDGTILLSDLEKAIDERTKVVCINRTTWHLGFTYDVEAVVKLAHEKGALVVDDAFQAVGAIQVDVHKEKLDCLLAGSYKWQCGPPKAGIFYIREDLIEQFEPSHYQYTHVIKPKHLHFSQPQHDNVKSYRDYPFVNTADKFSDETIAMSMVWGYKAALEYLNELRVENIQNRNHKLANYLVDRLQAIECTVNTPLDDKTTFENLHLINYTTGSDKNDRNSCETLEYNLPIPIRGPTMRYQGGRGGIRVCTHFFNTKEDIDTFIFAQRKLLKNGS